MGSPRVGVCGAHRVLYGHWRELPIRCAPPVNDRRRHTMTARSDAGRRVVIFVHIGKTAGTTLGAIATRQYPSKSIFQVDSGAQMTPAEQVRALPPATKRNLSLIMGHLQFGVHSDLPLPSTYTTLLRDPVRANRVQLSARSPESAPPSPFTSGWRRNGSSPIRDERYL